MDITGLPRDQAQSKFFKLPPEIRNRIYEGTLYILTQDGVLDLTRQADWQRTQRALNILRLCRGIWEEARDTLFNVNRLMVDFGPMRSNFGHALRAFIRQHTQPRLDAIITIAIRGIASAEHCTVAFKLLRRMRRLETVRVDMDLDHLWYLHAINASLEYTQRETPFLRVAILGIKSLRNLEVNFRQRHAHRPPDAIALAALQDFVRPIQQALADRNTDEE